MKLKEEKAEMPLTDDNWLRAWVEPGDIKSDLKIQREVSSKDSESDELAREYENEHLSDGAVENGYLAEQEEKSHLKVVEGESSLEKDVTVQGTNSKTITARSKHIGHFDVGKVKKYRNILKELCQGAPEVSGEVTNMCRFRCSQCNKDIKCWRLVCNHFWAEHRQRISYRDVPKYISKKACHICRICGEKLLCDSYFLWQHLEKHNIKISHYKEKFLFTLLNRLPNAVYSDNLIGNLCIYQCETCKQTYSSRSLFAKHLRSLSHGSALNVGINLKKKVFHQCKLCDKSVLCDNVVVYGHIFNTHGLTPESYCKQTGCTLERTRHFRKDFLTSLKESKKIKNACEFKCNICEITYNKVSNFRDHFHKHNIKPPGHFSDYLTKGSFYQCKKCNKILLCDIKTIQHHMNVVHGTKMNINVTVVTSHKREYEKLYTAFTKNIPIASKVWKVSAVPMTNVPLQDVTSKLGDLCTYYCPTCNSESFTRWPDLTNHYQDLHGCSLKFNPKHVSVARYHTCLICPKAILCDQYFLRPHLRYCHKMSLTKYQAIFRRNGGEILPSFTLWRTKTNRKSTV